MRAPSNPSSSSGASTGRVAICDGAIDIGGRLTPLYSGALHYWRVSRKHWDAGLKAIKSLGLSIVESYVPWGLHENEDGSFEFGRLDPQRDLRAFIDRVAAHDLKLILRPGPHINAELTYFGLPERIVTNPEMMARSASGAPVVLFFPPTMFAVPSYASKAFLKEVESWYGVVAEQIDDQLYPDGPIIMLQVDNEAAFYFRDGVFDQDYHPDAIEMWQGYLRQRYRNIDALNSALHASYADWDSIDPARSLKYSDEPKDLAASLAWAEFQERLVTDSLTKMSQSLRETNLGRVPLSHNLPPGDFGTPMHLTSLQRRFELVGMDYYHRRSDYNTIKRRTLLLAGSAKLPYSPELGVGAPPWLPPHSDEDSLFTALVALAHGLRGFNLYMAIDRDRWCGAAYDRRGKPRPLADAFAALISGLHETDFHTLHVPTHTAIMLPREYQRLSRATYRLGGFSATFVDMLGGEAFAGCDQREYGLRSAVQIRWWQYVRILTELLDRHGLKYHFVDSEADDLDLLRYGALIAPTYDFTDETRWEKLRKLASRGVRVVVGPSHPERGISMEPRTFDEIPNAEVIDLNDEQMLQLFVASLPTNHDGAILSCSDAAEMVVHFSGDEPRVVFLIRAGNTNATVKLSATMPLSLHDVLSEEIFLLSPETHIEMPPRSCRMFKIVRPARRPSARARNKKS